MAISTKNTFTVTYDLNKSLHFDPFSGSYGYAEKHAHRDKIDIATRDNKCHHCNAVISEKEKYRKVIRLSEGEALTFCFCSLCCVAIILDHENEGCAFDNRTGKH